MLFLPADAVGGPGVRLSGEGGYFFRRVLGDGLLSMRWSKDEIDSHRSFGRQNRTSPCG